MDRYKKMIIIVSFIILILLVVIFIFNIYSNRQEEREEVEIEYGGDGEFIPKTELERVKGEDVYYIIERIINTYITYLKQANGIMGYEEIQEQEVKDAGFTMIYNVLDEEYISEFEITEDNMPEKIEKYENYNLEIKEMYLYEKSEIINYYFVYTMIDDLERNFIVKTDIQNKTFSMFLPEYLEEKKYTKDMDEKDFNMNDKSIEQNDNNTFKYVRISDEYMATQYLSNWKKKVLNNPEEAYKYLNEEYKDKRFGSYEEFYKYVEYNKEEIAELEIKEYVKNLYEDYTEYVCKDQHENVYVFNAEAIMYYKVILDTYTIEDEEYTEKYEREDDQTKVAMNIDKWVKMINNRDYKAAYKVLDETFRKNYFDTVDKFEEYMRTYFPAHYQIAYEEFSSESGVYIQELRLHDISQIGDYAIQETFIMKLEDNNEFVMSFKIITQ